MTPIPATIPGLLRDGTSVRVIGASSQITGCDHAIVHSVHGDEACVSPKPMPYESTVPVYLLPVADLVLDLDDATTRAHLAWWVFDQSKLPINGHRSIAGYVTFYVRDVLDACLRGRPVALGDLHALTTVARHLAGLESS